MATRSKPHKRDVVLEERANIQFSTKKREVCLVVGGIRHFHNIHTHDILTQSISNQQPTHHNKKPECDVIKIHSMTDNQTNYLLSESDTLSVNTPNLNTNYSVVNVKFDRVIG